VALALHPPSPSFLAMPVPLSVFFNCSVSDAMYKIKIKLYDKITVIRKRNMKKILVMNHRISYCAWTDELCCVSDNYLSLHF